MIEVDQAASRTECARGAARRQKPLTRPQTLRPAMLREMALTTTAPTRTRRPPGTSSAARTRATRRFTSVRMCRSDATAKRVTHLERVKNRPMTAVALASVEDVETRLRSTGYLPSAEIATSVFLADRLEKPVLGEGPAGVGKTDLARAFAQATGRTLVRLQCYEGLDEAKALYEWEYAKQLLYTQSLKDKIGEVLRGAETLTDAVERISAEDDVFFSDRFILPRPLLRAISAAEPCVLLIDEIDKSDTEFEAFLLEVLSDFQVSVPEIGTLRAKHVP